MLINAVAPFAGAWIEIARMDIYKPVKSVAPFAGAWIEIGQTSTEVWSAAWSLPSRERGLK